MSAPRSPLTTEQRAYSRKALAYCFGVCAAMSAVAYYIGVAPALASLSDRQRSERELIELHQKSGQLSNDMLDTRRQLFTARKELADLPLRLEPASAVNRRINLLAGVAAEAEVTLNEIQPQPAVDGEHYQTVPIRVAGSGDYPACAKFLHALRERFPDTTVQSFDTQNEAPSRDVNIANFRIELAWHTSPPAK